MISFPKLCQKYAELELQLPGYVNRVFRSPHSLGDRRAVMEWAEDVLHNAAELQKKMDQLKNVGEEIHNTCNPQNIMDLLLSPDLGKLDDLFVDEILGIEAVYQENNPEELQDRTIFYQGTNYRDLVQMTRSVPFTESDVVYDIGCGYGRVLAVLALLTPVKQVVGIEIMPHRAAAAEQSMADLGLTNVKVINKDVEEVDFCDGNYFYFFCPLPTRICQATIDRIAKIPQATLIVSHGVYAELKTAWEGEPIEGSMRGLDLYHIKNDLRQRRTFASHTA